MMSSTMDLSELSAKVALTETESLELQKKVTALIEDAEDAELTSLRTQNSKLKYRKEFLRKVIAEKSQPNGTTAKPNRGTMESMLQSIREIFDVAVKKAYPELENPPVDIGKSSRQEVDYQCNSALQLSKLLKGTGKPSNPREIAAALVSNVPTK
ncbi:Arginine--tRNA ligase, cytoplasmic [Halotydeus destructor]|nr:Arginine--tRNA ligase, cytoplasmic [Halotydeus destructor]